MPDEKLEMLSKSRLNSKLCCCRDCIYSMSDFNDPLMDMLLGYAACVSSQAKLRLARR